MAALDCPLCGAMLEDGAFLCPECGWDLSADGELLPTLFSAAGSASHSARTAPGLLSGADPVWRALCGELGARLFAGHSADTLRACLGARDLPYAAVRLAALRPGDIAEGEGLWWCCVLDTSSRAFHTLARKAEIIRFRGELSGLPENALDLSQGKNGGVMGFLREEAEGMILTICGDGGVCAPEIAVDLFSGLDRLRTIDFGGCFHTELCVSMSRMFKDCLALESLDLSSFRTARVRNMNGMFHGCASLESLDLSSFRTARTQSMRGMFRFCTALRQLDLSRFDTAQVIDFSEMFFGCTALDALDLSAFDTGEAQEMGNMFSDCSSLRELDLSAFNTARVLDMRLMFCGCGALEKLNVSSFHTERVLDMSGMFSGCATLRDLDLSSFTIGERCNTMDMLEDVPRRKEE